MPTSIAYVSFLVRLWRPADDDSVHPSAGWHSEVEHIQTGERWDFETLQELLDFLRRQAEARQALTPTFDRQQGGGAPDGTPPGQSSKH